MATSGSSIGRARHPRALDQALLPYERKVIVTRKHPAILRTAAALAMTGLAVASIATGYLGTDVLTGAAWAGAAYLSGALAWKVTVWLLTYLVVTDLRVILITGVLNRRITIMPIAKITDLNLEKPLPGQLLGYGKLIIENAGQSHPLSNVDFVPKPEKVIVAILTTRH